MVNIRWHLIGTIRLVTGRIFNALKSPMFPIHETLEIKGLFHGLRVPLLEIVPSIGINSVSRSRARSTYCSDIPVSTLLLVNPLCY
jgi:hypothetical protein